MFKDYYKILEINPGATKKEVKKAYRKMALKWHPDRNRSEEATQKMQEINEAYKILYDDVLREKYYQEYQLFMNYGEEQDNTNDERVKDPTQPYPDYGINDETLKEAIRQAREEAKKMADYYYLHHKYPSPFSYGQPDSCWETFMGVLLISFISVLIKHCQ